MNLGACPERRRGRVTDEVATAGHPCCSPPLEMTPRVVVPGVMWEGSDVLETIAIILIVLWLLGMVSGYTLGNFIWILLVIAVVLFLVRLVSGRRVI